MGRRNNSRRNDGEVGENEWKVWNRSGCQSLRTALPRDDAGCYRSEIHRVDSSFPHREIFNSHSSKFYERALLGVWK